MKIKTTVIWTLFFFFSLTLNAQTLLSTSHAFPGDILTTVINGGGPGDEILVLLLDEKGISRANAPGLIFDLEEVEGSQFIALLGLGSDLKPGNYKLRAEIRNSEGTSIHERPVLIRSRDFISEDIPLNRNMTDLRSSDSSKKRDQSRSLWALLNEVSDAPVIPLGIFLSPVEDFIQSSWYGDRRTYLYSDGETASSLHNGMDMAAETGTDIRTPIQGTVVMAEERILTGWTVVMEHLPGVYSLYYHMDKMYVELGDQLSQGDIMGTVGATGLVTGPHLHWELRVNTIPVDPEIYLSYPLIDKDGIISIIDDTIKDQGR